MTLTKLRLFLADDEQILLEALKTTLMGMERYTIVGTATDGRDAADQIAESKPDIAILDIAMPNLNGIEIAKRLIQYYPKVHIILLSGYEDEDYVREALKIGVRGYVLKTSPLSALIEAMETVQKGGVYLSPRISGKLVEAFSSGCHGIRGVDLKFDSLTDREREVLSLIVAGKTQREMASLLFVASTTIKSHKVNIMKKLNVHKAMDLLKYAVRNGIVKL